MTAARIALTPADLALAARLAQKRHNLNRVFAGSRNDRIDQAPDLAIDRVGAEGALAFCRLAGVSLEQHERTGVAKGGIVLDFRGERLRVASSRARTPSYVHHPSRPFDVDLAVVMEETSLLSHTWRIAGWLTADDFRRYAREADLGRGRTIVVANRFLRPARELWQRGAPEQLSMAEALA